MMMSFKRVNVKAMTLAMVLASPFAAYGMDKDEKSQQKEQKDFKGEDGKEQKLQPQNKVMSDEQKFALLKEVLGEDAQCSVCTSLLFKKTDDNGKVTGDCESKEIFVTCITPTKESKIPVHACHRECLLGWQLAKMDALRELRDRGVNPVDQQDKIDALASRKVVSCALCGKNVESLERQLDLLARNNKQFDDNRLCDITKVFISAQNYINPVLKSMVDSVTVYEAFEGRDKVVEMLIKAGADLLHNAASFGQDKSIEILVKAGANVNQPNKNGWTPLDMAVLEGHDKCIEALIKAGAAIDKADNLVGDTPLHQAAYKGKDNCVALLVQAGAAIDKPDKYGWTSLHWAARQGHGSTVERLVGYGADHKFENNEGQQTPAQLADVSIREIFSQLIMNGFELRRKRQKVQLMFIKNAMKNILGWEGGAANVLCPLINEYVIPIDIISPELLQEAEKQESKKN